MIESNNQSQSLSNIEGVRDIDPETSASYSGGRGFRFGSDPDVILYTKANGQGASLNINAASFDGLPNIGEDFNDKVSSIRIRRGEWRFFKDANYEGLRTPTLGAGKLYNIGKNNDEITSAFRVR